MDRTWRSGQRGEDEVERPRPATVPRANALLALQASAGNAAVTQMVQGRTRLQRQPKPDAAPTGKAPGGIEALKELSHPLKEAGGGQAHLLDWNSKVGNENVGIAPPETDMKGKTLREVFNAHLAKQLTTPPWPEGTTPDNVAAAVTTPELQKALFRANQYAMVETLRVKESQRYKAKGGMTYCTTYATNFVNSLGAYLPLVWWRPDIAARIEAGELVPTTPDQTAPGSMRGNRVSPRYFNPDPTLTEMKANEMTDWMEKYGSRLGWTSLGDKMEDAQKKADAGNIVILLAKHKEAKKSGHVDVVLAQDMDKEDRKGKKDAKGDFLPLQSSAGGGNDYAANTDYGLFQGEAWWKNTTHQPGAAWVWTGAVQSTSVVPPHRLGFEKDKPGTAKAPPKPDESTAVSDEAPVGDPDDTSVSDEAPK